MKNPYGTDISPSRYRREEKDRDERLSTGIQGYLDRKEISITKYLYSLTESWQLTQKNK